MSERLSALERLVLAFIVSISFVSLLTAGLSLVTTNYLFYASVISLGLGSILVLTFLARRFSSLGLPKVERGSVPLLFAILTYSVMVIALFWSAPYYPTAEAPDLLYHARVIQAIVEGNARPELLQANYPIGLHFVTAVLASLVQVLPLDAARLLISPVLLAIISLVFFSARLMFKSEKMASVTALIAAFVLPVDAIHFVKIGTYPNIIGDAIILTVLWLFLSYIRKPSKAIGATLTFLGLAGMFTHSSFLTFLGVLLVSNLLIFPLFKKQFRRYLQATLFSAGGVGLLALLLWSFLQRNLDRILVFYLGLGSSSGTPDLRITSWNLILNFGFFYGWVNVIIVSLAIVLVLLKKRDNLGLVFAVLWMLILLVAPFFSGQEYRFVLLSTLPATFLIGNLIGSVSENLNRSSVHFAPRIRKSTRMIVPLALVVLAMSGSLGSLIPKIYNPYGRLRQEAIFESMMWIENGSCSGGVVSSGLWPDYQYLPTLTGVTYRSDFVRPPEVILQKSAELGFSCIVVSTTSSYFQSFELDQHFQEKYRNNMVAIFIIKP